MRYWRDKLRVHAAWVDEPKQTEETVTISCQVLAFGIGSLYMQFQTDSIYIKINKFHENVTRNVFDSLPCTYCLRTWRAKIVESKDSKCGSSPCLLWPANHKQSITGTLHSLYYVPASVIMTVRVASLLGWRDTVNQITASRLSSHLRLLLFTSFDQQTQQRGNVIVSAGLHQQPQVICRSLGREKLKF